MRKPNEMVGEKLMTRDEAAAFLTEQGFKTTPLSLRTYVTRGNGPLFRSFGRIPLYSRDHCLDWARSRLSAPHRTADAKSA